MGVLKPTSNLIERLKTFLMLHGKGCHLEDRVPKEEYEPVEECLEKLKELDNDKN